jgi:hypothetical protein
MPTAECFRAGACGKLALWESMRQRYCHDLQFFPSAMGGIIPQPQPAYSPDFHWGWIQIGHTLLRRGFLCLLGHLMGSGSFSIEHLTCRVRITNEAE